jgi:hypothetical protein
MLGMIYGMTSPGPVAHLPRLQYHLFLNAACFQTMNRCLHKGDYGIATECGWGRRNPETIRPLIKLHKDISESLPA